MAGGESSPRLSMVSARVCHSDVHHQRYTHSHKPTFPAFPRYQLTNSHGQLEDGRWKKEGRVLRCYHPHSPWSGTITPLFFWGGGSSARQRAQTGNTDQTITTLKNKQVQTKEFPTEVQQTRGHGENSERSSAKLHKTTKLQQNLGRTKQIYDKKRSCTTTKEKICNT